MRFLLGRPPQLVTAEEALLGRDQRMRVPDRHEVQGTPLEPPFPEGLEQAVVDMNGYCGLGGTGLACPVGLVSSR